MPFGTMDLSVLQKQIQADVAANRTPLFVVADIGSSLCGNVDNLTRLQEICRTNNIWLHAAGHGLAALAVTQGPGNVWSNHPTLLDLLFQIRWLFQLRSAADSITVNLGSWLGIPSLPIVVSIQSPCLFFELSYSRNISGSSFFIGRCKISRWRFSTPIRSYHAVWRLSHCGQRYRPWAEKRLPRKFC